MFATIFLEAFAALGCMAFTLVLVTAGGVALAVKLGYIQPPWKQ